MTASLKVKNTGKMEGQEIVQLYVRDVAATAFRPDKELKGFAKVSLKPGEERVVTFELDRRAFAYYDVPLGDWHVEPGAFEILVGGSSRDIRLSAAVQAAPTQLDAPAVDRENLAQYYDFPKGSPVSQESFEALLGRSVPGNEVVEGEPYTINTPISDMQASFVGRMLRKMMQRQIERMIADDLDSATAQLMRAIVQEAPLRTMMMGEGVSREMLDALLLMVNGKFLKGLVELVKAIRTR